MGIRAFALVWPETPDDTLWRRLSCALEEFQSALSFPTGDGSSNSRLAGMSVALLVTLVLSLQLSCVFGDFRAPSVTLIRSRRQPCALGNSRALCEEFESAVALACKQALF